MSSKSTRKICLYLTIQKHLRIWSIFINLSFSFSLLWNSIFHLLWLMTLDRIHAQWQGLKSHRAVTIRQPNKIITRLAPRNNNERYDEQTTLSATIGREPFSVSNMGDLPSRDCILVAEKAKTSVVCLFFVFLGVQWDEDWVNNAIKQCRRSNPKTRLHVNNYSNHLH